MIGDAKMTELVHHDIPLNVLRSHDEPPVEREVVVGEQEAHRVR